VRPLAPPCITHPTDRLTSELEEKRRIDADPRRVTVAELEGSRDAQVEMAHAMREESGNPLVPAPLASPLKDAAAAVQEDLVLLREDGDGSVRLIAGALHFPSNWSLAEKLGQEFLEIHKPVRGFSETKTAARSLELMRRLRADSPVWRSNWTLQAGDRLDLSPEVREDWIGLRDTVTADNVFELMHLRLEYQKLFRLPLSGAILFSIHTLVVSLEEVVRTDPEGGLLLATLQSLDPEIAAYKGMTRTLPFVRNGLAERLASG